MHVAVHLWDDLKFVFKISSSIRGRGNELYHIGDVSPNQEHWDGESRKKGELEYEPTERKRLGATELREKAAEVRK